MRAIQKGVLIMRKFVVLIAATAVSIAILVPSAEAHTLSLVRAHSSSVKQSKDLCSLLDPLTCTDTHVEPCKRLSAHKVRCNVTVAVTDGQTSGECTYTDQWSIKHKSKQLHWSPALFNHTLACL
jgi:hypothetical protein